MKSKQSTFVSLYYDLLPTVHARPGAEPADPRGLIVFWTCLIVVSYGFALTKTMIDLRQDYSVTLADWVGAMVVFCAMTFMLIETALFAVFLLLIFMGNTPQQVRLLCARLLTVTPHPYGRYLGLGKNDLHKLRQIAAIEQSAADWRGNVITILFIIAGFGGLGAMLGRLFESPDWFEGVLHWWQSGPLMTSFFISLAVLVVTGFLRLTRLFLTNEFGNRAIVLACEEALALLDAFEMPSGPLDTIQKRSLALRLDCHLNAHLEKDRTYSLIGKGSDPQTGKTWYLTIREKKQRWMRRFINTLEIWRKKRK